MSAAIHMGRHSAVMSVQCKSCSGREALSLVAAVYPCCTWRSVVPPSESVVQHTRAASSSLSHLLRPCMCTASMTARKWSLLPGVCAPFGRQYTSLHRCIESCRHTAPPCSKRAIFTSHTTSRHTIQLQQSRHPFPLTGSSSSPPFKTSLAGLSSLFSKVATQRSLGQKCIALGPKQILHRNW